jgi:hypothetical protein
MARIVLNDAKVTINSVNLSDHIASVTINQSFDVVETTAFSSTAAKTRVAGLQDNSVTLEFHQDFAASNVEATLNTIGSSLLGTTTTVVVLPTSSAVGAANPSYTFTALCSEWTPINGSVGELATVSVTWPITGAITKAVA